MLGNEPGNEKWVKEGLLTAYEYGQGDSGLEINGEDIDAVLWKLIEWDIKDPGSCYERHGIGPRVRVTIEIITDGVAMSNAREGRP